MLQLQLNDAIEAINAVLEKGHELNCPAKEIRNIEYKDASGEIVEVKCFGMNDEPLTFDVHANLQTDELEAVLVEGEIT